MSNQHFHYFRVKNFKRFKDLEITNIGQFNLVLGDNNVGKTSLLEALMFNENFDVFIDSLSKVLYERQTYGNILPGGIWEFFANKDELVNNDYVTSTFCTDNTDRKEFPFAFDKLTKELFLRNNTAQFDEFINGEKFEKKNWQIKNPTSFGWTEGYICPMVKNLVFNHSDITTRYSELINNGPRSNRIRFIKALKQIDSSVLSLDYDTTAVKDKTLITVESEKSDGRILLALQGDGFLALFRVILYVINFRGKRLMIDEIDAGVHYSRMKDYWKVVLQAAHENEVQIFATTHNRECIQFFIEALEELGEDYQNRARAIKLVEHAQTKEVLAFTKPFEKIEEDLAVGNEVR